MKSILKRRETTLFILLVALVLLVSLRSSSFIGPASLNSILNDTCALLVVSLGQFLVILIGGIDLSVASNMAFTGMVTALLNKYYPGIPAWLFLPIGAAIGAGLGSINGALVAFGALPPMIATIATMSIYRGFVYVFSKGAWVVSRDMTPGFLSIPGSVFLGLTSFVWITIGVILIAWIFMRYTSSGREVYAFGGNRTAALFAGVRERKVEMLVMTVSGMLAGLIGVLWVARYGNAHSETAADFHMQTVAACVLGGVSFVGGAGTVVGVVIGALFFGVVNNALTVVHISPFFQMVIQGVVILVAIVSNTLIDRQAQMRLIARRKI
jgi:rhamnose transport system permease protein